MSQADANNRIAPRIKLPAMYTLVRVRPQGHPRYCWTGYIYDISESGMRFELDSPVDPGTTIEVRAMLPGANHVTFQATGRVIRFHDDADEQGPMRMGMTFEKFTNTADRLRLTDYITTNATRQAA